jgi:hypothetical protein
MKISKLVLVACVTLSILSTIIVLPAFIPDAIADTCTSQICGTSNTGQTCSCPNGQTCNPIILGNYLCVAAPEMSDYLAASFIAVSTMMVLYLRKRRRSPT